MSFIDNLTAQLPFGKKSPESEYFFALNIGLSQVTAAVWSISGHDLDILGQATLEYEGTDDLLEKAYKALDKSMGALEVEPQKILFGVPDPWSMDDDLKDPYSKLLKKMLKEYELEPMAFVTIQNAVTFLLQKQEGVPPTAILIGVGDFLESTLVRGGKPVDTKAVKRTGQILEEIEKTAGQFTEVEVLPSRILLYSTKEGENLAKVKDELMSYPWMQKMPFLHFPKIEVLDDSITTEAVVAAGAVEIDPHINFKHAFPVKKQYSPLHHSNSLTDIPESLRLGRKHTGDEEPAPAAREPGGHPLKRYHQGVGTEDGQPEDLGFVKGDIKDQQEIDDLIEEEALEPYQAPRRKRSWTKLFRLPVIRNVSQVFKFEGNLGKFIFIPIILALVCAGYLFLVKAAVTVYVEPRVLEQDTEVVADPRITSVDEEKKLIPGSIIETTVSGSGKASATGQKQIGDPARGKVVVFNRTSSKVSFSQGTVLTADNGLKFTIDSAVSVASQSSTTGADFSVIIKAGKSDPVGVSAEAIGPESNLPGNTELVVAGYSKSQVLAQVADALSGGTSKKVTVVTADDQKKLQAQVLNDLRSKAESDLQGKMSGDKKIISEALSVVDGKYSYNKKINDQANEFSLNADVRFKGTSYSDSDLKTIVSKLIKTNVPEGFELNVSSMETQADISKVEKDGRLVFKAKFKAKLLPKIDAQDLKKKIRGKSIKEVADQLKGIENVIGSEIKFNPWMPQSFARLPLLDRNITINITPK